MAFKITFVGLAALLIAAALVQVGLAGPASSNSATVAVSQSKLGRILVDRHGRSLYLFGKDRRGASGCYGACATYWPPLLSPTKPRPGSGIHALLLGLTRRTGGTKQVTYAGHPLYTFIGDKQAGQTTGEGLTNFGAAWDVVASSGRPIEPTAADTRASANTDGSYSGYGG